MEIKQMELFPNYGVCDEGYLLNLVSNKPLKGYLQKSGFITVTLYGESVYLHRLIAEHFVPNPHSYNRVFHKDGDKTNNLATNLEWRKTFADDVFKTSALSAYNLDGTVFKRFVDIYEAEREGYRLACIRLCLKGKQATHGKLTWQFAE